MDKEMGKDGIHEPSITKVKGKVVEVVRSAQRGGVETHVRDLIEYAVEAGYEVTLVSLANVEPDKKFMDLGIEIIKLNDSMWMSGRSFKTVYPLYRLLKRIRPDVVHSHGTRPILIGSMAARLAGVGNIISTVHNSYKLMGFNYDGTIRRYA